MRLCIMPSHFASTYMPCSGCPLPEQRNRFKTYSSRVIELCSFRLRTLSHPHLDTIAEALRLIVAAPYEHDLWQWVRLFDW